MVRIEDVEANAYHGDPRYIYMALWGHASGDGEGIRNDFVYYCEGDPASNHNTYSLFSYYATNTWVSNRPFWFIWACDSEGNTDTIVDRTDYGEPSRDHGEHDWDDDYNQEYDPDMVFAFSVYVSWQFPTQEMVNNYREWEQHVLQTGNNQWGFCDNIDFEWVIPYRNVPWQQNTTDTLTESMNSMQIDDDDDHIQMGPDHPDYNDNHVNDRMILRF